MGTLPYAEIDGILEGLIILRSFQLRYVVSEIIASVDSILIGEYIACGIP